jgi:hypothetical protein
MIVETDEPFNLINLPVNGDEKEKVGSKSNVSVLSIEDTDLFHHL